VKNKIYIYCIFIIGTFLRLYPAIIHPLWLDEIYSLYFASNFSYLQIIFRLPDCHPGLFYLFLKFLLNFSTSTIFLRIILGIIPQIIGCFIIESRYKKPILTTALLLNPFFIHLAWQIRMYSLVFIITILIISLITKPNFSIYKLVILLFLGNLISYSFIIPSLCLILYLSIHLNKKIILLFPLIVLEFFVFKGPQYKALAETASWISTPSFNNIGSVILTTLGFAQDINSQSTISLLSSVIFYISSGYLIYKISKKFSLFLFNFTLSLIVTIILSILIPFLSQHYFFYNFIPKVSLFLPRFLLPMSVIFYIYFFKLYYRYQKLIIIILILFWIPTFNVINLNSPYFDASTRNVNSSNTIFLPPWENLFLPPKYSTNDINHMVYKYNLAENIEKDLLKQQPKCINIDQNLKYIDQNLPALNQYQEQVKTSLKNCLLKFPGNQ